MEVFCLTAQKSSPLKIAGKWLCLLLTVLFLLAACGLAQYNMIAFIIAVVFGLVWGFMQFRGDIEYECSYFDGDIRFARIRSKSSRKALTHYSIDEVVIIAPGEDRSMYKYENDKTLKVYDYTSRKKDVPHYDMVVKNGTTTLMYKLELDDKYLDSVCIKHPEKVIRRK